MQENFTQGRHNHGVLVYARMMEAIWLIFAMCTIQTYHWQASIGGKVPLWQGSCEGGPLT